MNWHKTLNYIFDHSLFHPPLILDVHYKTLIIFPIFLYFIHPVGKWSKSLTSQNTEKGSIIWSGAPNIQIWINPCTIFDENYHPYGKKCIRLTHEYTWDIIKGNPILKYTYSSYRLPPPLSTKISFIISY